MGKADRSLSVADFSLFFLVEAPHSLLWLGGAGVGQALCSL